MVTEPSGAGIVVPALPVSRSETPCPGRFDSHDGTPVQGTPSSTANSRPTCGHPCSSYEVGYLPLGPHGSQLVFQLVGPTYPPRAGRFPPVPSAAGRVTSAPFKGSTR